METAGWRRRSLSMISCTRFSHTDITQKNVPEFNCPSGNLGLLAFHVDGDVFLGCVFVLQPVIGLAFEALIDGDHTDIPAVGLTFEVADIMYVIPLDAYAVVV